MRRRGGVVDTRLELIASAKSILELAHAVGDDNCARHCEQRLADLHAGRAVVVQHGWEISDLDPDGGPFVLGSDNMIVEIPRQERSRIEYRAPDRNLVDLVRRERRR